MKILSNKDTVHIKYSLFLDSLDYRSNIVRRLCTNGTFFVVSLSFLISTYWLTLTNWFQHQDSYLSIIKGETNSYWMTFWKVFCVMCSPNRVTDHLKIIIFFYHDVEHNYEDCKSKGCNRVSILLNVVDNVNI
jgi:hypothetical protein